jgi:competence protein ComEA
MSARLGSVRALARRLATTLRASAWLPVATKALLVAALLGALALLGSGALDRYVMAADAFAPARAGLGPPGVRARPDAATSAAATASASAALSASGAPSASASPAAPPAAAMTPDGKVILNLAGEAELARIPGVGPKRAKAIIALRDKLGGRFKRLEDLMRIRGLKRRALERIKPHVVLDAPAAP